MSDSNPELTQEAGYEEVAVSPELKPSQPTLRFDLRREESRLLMWARSWAFRVSVAARLLCLFFAVVVTPFTFIFAFDHRRIEWINVLQTASLAIVCLLLSIFFVAVGGVCHMALNVIAKGPVDTDRDEASSG